jgi:mono/diheme cytochrome c family protein
VKVSALSALALTTACEWFTDFKRQPYVATWESMRTDTLIVRGSPQGSVPTTGTALPGFAVSYSQLPGTIDSMTALINPTPVSEASLANGRKYYQINCAVCHGDRADGTGLATRYGFVPISLQLPLSQARSDGYIYGMIRNGRGLMPSYNRIEEMDRWDVVNYLRALQGRVTNVAFETGPLALPGVTGDKLPGATRLGPNRWVPHVGAGSTPAADSAAAPGADATRPAGPPARPPEDGQ